MVLEQYTEYTKPKECEIHKFYLLGGSSSSKVSVRYEAHFTEDFKVKDSF